ncbi:serine/threonine protein phosphatase-like protein 4 [Sarcoptes scabiei]|uniref:Serine/threonine-protein phosphatase n=1 Tax=Sarcoptes scabiei TaxID=52283 RepID=A0A132A3H5_SARSC|nr:serine/threonine protein phosphatase-like protein 4 [Sarcoptes scabiei]
MELADCRRKYLTLNCLHAIFESLRRLLFEAPNLVRLNDSRMNYHFFGDIHGSLSDLIFLWDTFWRDSNKIEQNHFVFLGDYVDRGIHGLEVSIRNPKNFTILRGNHEFFNMNYYSLLPEMQIKYGNELGYQMWTRLNDCFALLPYAAIVYNNIFCCHGGIPKHLRKMEEIESIPKSLADIEEDSVAFQLLWNDFYTRDLLLRTNEFYREPRYFSPNVTRGAGFMIGNRAVERFLRRFQLSYIVRGHDFMACEQNGYDYIELSNGAVFTLFTNSSYTGSINNTAYLHVNIQLENVKIFPLVLESEEFFNKSEMIENDAELVAMKFKDPYSEQSNLIRQQSQQSQIRIDRRIEEPIPKIRNLAKSRSRRKRKKYRTTLNV